jgi:TrmH family RNA methyltransferase
VVQFPSLPTVDAIVKATDLIVLGDQIQDPGNVGTIIRTAEAAGAGGVFLTTGSAYRYGDKVIRASMGSLFRLPVKAVADSGRDLYDRCLSGGWQPVFTVPEGGVPLWEVDFTKPTLLVFGNEGAGISPELIAKNKGRKLSIPLTSPVESLNVAIAAAVVLFEIVRQRSISHSCK